VAVGGAVLHVDEGVVHVAVGEVGIVDVGGIIRADSDEGDAFIVIVGVELLNAAFVEVRFGAVIAIENECQDF